MTLEVDVFGTTTIAMCVFFLGYAIVMRSQLLREYSIPEPVIGGFACAILIALIYYIANVEITFDLSRRDILLEAFAKRACAGVAPLLSGLAGRRRAGFADFRLSHGVYFPISTCSGQTPGVSRQAPAH